MTIRIAGTGIGLPARRVSNDELAEVAGLDTSDEWIRTRTGIGERRIATTETLADLATTAARGALADAGIDASEIDYLLVATLAGDTRTPALACHIAERLGMTCAAADVNAACTGFLYALDLAAGLVARGRAGRVLIVSAEKMSAHVDWQDRSTAVLFGDGASACVVVPGNALKFIHVGVQPDTRTISLPNDMTGSNPFAEVTHPAGPLFMDGQTVFKYAVRMMEQGIQRALDGLELPPEAIDHYLIHQANRRIIDFAISRLRQPPEKFPMNVEHYGNTSAVSIPLLMHEMRGAGLIEPGQRLLLVAFGAGMTHGSAVLEWE